MTDHKKDHNRPYLKDRRKNLRNRLTPAEAAFWKVLKSQRFEGRKFRRQHSVGNYVLDFYCPDEKLAIELDGEVHFNVPVREYDAKRKSYLNGCGIRVLRFENKWIFQELELVLHIIEQNFGWSKTTTPALKRHPS